ncbi:MAG: NAD+ synthase [Desulfatiglans sp.]|jgi:NAD+ synthetase|nr:NAD+ synthase [Desulfatiglans sp.]
MKIAVCQLNPVIGDFDHNTSMIREAAVRAKQSGCGLVVFPEMCLPGYPPKDLLEKSAFVRENLIQLEKLARDTSGIHILCGYVDKNPSRIGKPLVNSVALIHDGRVIGKGGKRLLPDYDVFDETRYFQPSPDSLIFTLEGKRWGVTICEDIWGRSGLSSVPNYDIDPVSELFHNGLDVLINISASPFSLNKGPTRLRLLKNLSLTNNIPIIYCNQVGGNDDLLFDGSSMVVDSAGRLIRLGKEFETDLMLWDMKHAYEEVKNPWPSEEKSVLSGLIMGTRDYAEKCGFKKVLVGLSGGIDSSLVACIAREAMGPENVLGVGMPSQFTSQMSKDDARALSKNLGTRFEEIPITKLFEVFKKELAPLFRGLKEDETEENIQARIRGNLLMSLSNKFNALLLTTGNKSELAMGYCTLYGDMSGGLAVISDIPKTMCYRLANYINRDGEIIPQRIIQRPPSAELRPDQTDQDSLPPYEVLDAILEASLEENLGFEEIVERGHDPSIVRNVLQRVALNEYKRRQSPPGLRITTKAFGYGRRYPIARGRSVY